jgi:hypothetical protein
MRVTTAHLDAMKHGPMANALGNLKQEELG